MADLLFEYNIQQMAEIFDEDKSLKSTLMNYGLYLPDFTIEEKNPERILLYRDLASVLLANHDFIADREIDDLWSLRFLAQSINNIFNKPNVVDDILYRQIIFSYKYSTIKHFFRDNFTQFLPSLDASVVTDSEKMSLFQTAFMQEYDRFADIIDNIYNITDIDNVGNDYLSYLVQILGYEKGDDKLLGKDSFRELAKNIVEVYKIKGTNYSFELFFNFLGFDVELREFYFDKRFFDPGVSINPYTGADDVTDFNFYLTPFKPTEYTPENMNDPYQINDNQLTDIRSHLWWEKKIYEGSTPEQLLGLDEENPPEEGFDYSFFKTNIIQYSVKRIRSKETDADELSKEDEAIIQAYADFLTPIFISKQVLISIKPFEDVASSLIFKDSSYYNLSLDAWETMFKTSSNWYITDDWVEDPENASRFPLEFKELTDIENGGIDSEEPKEFYLWIKTYDHTLPSTTFTKDDMTQMYDNDETSDEWVPSPNYFKVEVLKTTDTDRFVEGDLVSLYDIAYTEDSFILSLLYQILPIDDPDGMTGISKILDFDETIFNRIHRLEELNVMSRDWLDWDNFQDIRKIPTFEDSFKEDFSLEQFSTEDSPGSSDIYISNDDDATHTPWWYYDKLLMKKTTYSFSGFGFIYVNTEVKGQLHVERTGGYPPGYTEFEDPIVASGGLEISDFTLILTPVSFGKIKMSGVDLVAPANFEPPIETAIATISAPDNIGFRENFIFVGNDYARLSMFGFYELESEVAGVFTLSFISSNKDVWTIVEGGSIIASGSPDVSLEFDRIGSGISLLTGTYGYDYVISRDSEGSINTYNGSSDVFGEGFIFEDNSDFATLDTTTPFIRAENSGFLFDEDFFDFAAAIGSGSSDNEANIIFDNDFANALTSYIDINPFINNLIFLYLGDMSAELSGDAISELTNPIFIVDSVPVLQTSGDADIEMSYEIEPIVSKIIISGSFLVENTQEYSIEDPVIHTSGNAISEIYIEIPNETAYLDTTTPAVNGNFEIVKGDVAEATISGSVNVDIFEINSVTLALPIVVSFYYENIFDYPDNVVFEVARDMSGSISMNGLVDIDGFIFEREMTGTINVNAEIPEIDQFDVTTILSEYDGRIVLLDNSIIENDYVDVVSGGVANTSGSANEDEQYLRYSPIVTSLGIFSDGDIISEVIYNDIKTAFITMIGASDYEESHIIVNTNNGGTSIVSGISEYEESHIIVNTTDVAIVSLSNTDITADVSDYITEVGGIAVASDVTAVIENIYENLTDVALSNTIGSSEQFYELIRVGDTAIVSMSNTDITADLSDYIPEVGGLSIASSSPLVETIFINTTDTATAVASGVSDYEEEHIFINTTDTALTDTSTPDIVADEVI